MSNALGFAATYIGLVGFLLLIWGGLERDMRYYPKLGPVLQIAAVGCGILSGVIGFLAFLIK